MPLLNIIADRNAGNFLSSVRAIIDFQGHVCRRFSSVDNAVEQFSKDFSKIISELRSSQDEPIVCIKIVEEYLPAFYRDNQVGVKDYETRNKVKALYAAVAIQRMVEIEEEASGRSNFQEIMMNQMYTLVNNQPDCQRAGRDSEILPRLTLSHRNSPDSLSLTRFYVAITKAYYFQSHANWKVLAMLVASLATGEGVHYCLGTWASEETVRREHLFLIMEKLAAAYQLKPSTSIKTKPNTKAQKRQAEVDADDSSTDSYVSSSSSTSLDSTHTGKRQMKMRMSMSSSGSHSERSSMFSLDENFLDKFDAVAVRSGECPWDDDVFRSRCEQIHINSKITSYQSSSSSYYTTLQQPLAPLPMQMPRCHVIDAPRHTSILFDDDDDYFNDWLDSVSHQIGSYPIPVPR